METKYPPIVQVDDFGKVVGPINYDIAHAKDGGKKGIRHLTAQIGISSTNKYEDLLISRRGNIDRPGKLNIGIGGHAVWIKSENRAQTPLENAIAETTEELFWKKDFSEYLELKEISEYKKDVRRTDPEYAHLFFGVYS